MKNRRERRIVIVGGGTAGWMTAAAMARFLTPGASIVLVESDEIGTVGVGEATIPGIRNYNNALEIDESEFLKATGGTYKLGIAFEGWSRPGDSYMHAFGLLGRWQGPIPFHHFWLRARALGIAKPLGNYSLNATVSGQNSFAPALAEMPYAFHFDAGLYARYLRRIAEARGVVRKEGRIVAVCRRANSGDVAEVCLASGTRICGDIFVDCSGFRGLLIEQELKAGFEDWSHWLPCDRAIAVPSARADPLVPYTRAIARRAGWQWRIPLQHRTGNGLVFCSRYMSEDEAAAVLLSNLGGKPTAEPRTIHFTTGMRRKSWVRNVVAIGLSSGFIEPLESTSIHLIQTAVNRLIDLMPRGEITDAARDEYNYRTEIEMSAIRDFIILHYHANRRVGEPFWDEVRNRKVPEKLQRRLNLFCASGCISRQGSELFEFPAWLQVMIGQNLDPKQWHPAVDQIQKEKLKEFLDAIQKSCEGQAAGMSNHEAFLWQFARMPPQQQTTDTVLGGMHISQVDSATRRS